MRVEYDLTPEDSADFGEHIARRSPRFQRVIHIGRVAGMLVLLLASGLLWLRTGSPAFIAIGLVTAVAWGWYWPRHVIGHVRKHMLRTERPCLRGRHSLEVIPTGLRAQCDVADTVIEWAGVMDILETDRHVFVMVGAKEGYVIPRRSVAAGDLDELVAQARQHRP